MKRCLACLTVVLLVFAATANFACADIFRLKTGGQITGTIVKRGEQSEYVVRTTDGVFVTLSRRQVDDIDKQDDVDLLYAERSRTMPDTVVAHRQLADWCRKNRRTKLSELHLERILELDPNNEAARLSLGYQQHQGRWLTRDQLMAARGLRQYGGKYRTPQDIALRERTKKREQAENDWFRNIRTWIGWLTDRRRSAEGAEKIANIDDSRAAAAIVKLLKQQKNQAVRDLLTATLAELQSPLAVTTLVEFSLNEPEPEVRLQCLDYLLQYHQPISLEPFIQALNDRKYSNEIINRAADCLRRIEDPRAISPLIDALVTTHKFKNRNAPVGNMNPTFPSGGGASGGGLSMGGDKKKTIVLDMQNLKVRQALVELSGGLDYEFDEKRWRIWFVNNQIHDYIDTRRDQ